MSTKAAKPEPHIVHHEDGSVWAKGQTLNGVPTGRRPSFREPAARTPSRALPGQA